MNKYLLFLFPVLFFTFAQPADARSTFSVKEGWNLVSTDVLEDAARDKSGFDELIAQGGAIFGLSSVDKKYYGGSGSLEKVEKGLNDLYRSLPDGDTYVPAFGWWFYSPRSVSLYIDFDISRDNVDNYAKAYRLNSGWNLVGITSMFLGKSLTEVRGSCEFVSVYHYENGSFRKQTDADLKEKLTEDSLGYALAIKVRNDCMFNFDKRVTPTPIPTIPE